MDCKVFQMETERLYIVPFDKQYLTDFYHEFTDEVARYLYPDPFSGPESAERLTAYFTGLMQEGKMLELLIITQNGEFIGSLEVHDLLSDAPELNIWVKTSAQCKGYGSEAMKTVLKYLNAQDRFSGYVCEVDKRNSAGLALLQKFHAKEVGYEKITTESGKSLSMKRFWVRQ